MISWGISANSHDAALAVFSKDGLEFAMVIPLLHLKKWESWLYTILLNRHEIPQNKV